MTKEYLAVLTGTLPKKEGRLEDMLLSNGKTNRTEVVDAKTSGAQKAVLEYKVKRTKSDYRTSASDPCPDGPCRCRALGRYPL